MGFNPCQRPAFVGESWQPSHCSRAGSGCRRRGRAQGDECKSDRRTPAHIHHKEGRTCSIRAGATEVYCWWPLPREVSASEITVDCMQGGAALSIVVRDVVIFEQKLFDCIKGSATLW